MSKGTPRSADEAERFESSSAVDLVATSSAGADVKGEDVVRISAGRERTFGMLGWSEEVLRLAKRQGDQQIERTWSKGFETVRTVEEEKEEPSPTLQHTTPRRTRSRSDSISRTGEYSRA